MTQQKVVVRRQGKRLVRTTRLKNVKYTGKLMKQIAIKHVRDVAPYARMTLREFFNFVKAIPYRKDPHRKEWLQRPYFTLRQSGRGGDCDDKSIVLASYLYMNGIPFRFVALGADPRGRFHHVITEAYLPRLGGWIHLDPTYANNTFARPMRRYAKRLVISD